MNKKYIAPIFVTITIIAVAVISLNSKTDNNVSDTQGSADNGAPKIESDAPAKEFTMTSFVEFVGDKPKPQFSLKEITVKRGDLVRLKITVTSGNHDLKIDEFNVYADTKPNEEMTIEFIADKTGEFIYYCTKPGHRENGHWGTLKVIE